MFSRYVSHLKAPVEVVWSVLSDHAGMSRWSRSMSASLVKPGNGDVNGVGAVRALRPGPPGIKIVEEVTVFRPNLELAYIALSGHPLRNYGGNVRLEVSPSGTTVVWEVRSDRHWVPGFAHVIGSTTVRNLSKQLARQVDAVQAQAAA